MAQTVQQLAKAFATSQRVHVGIWDILGGPYSRYMGTPLGPRYIPYTYMNPLGYLFRIEVSGLRFRFYFQGPGFRHSEFKFYVYRARVGFRPRSFRMEVSGFRF